MVLFLGMCVSVLVGGAAAVAEPSDGGRPWWHEREPQRVTGTVLSVEEPGTIVLDGLVSYNPVRAGIGTLTIDVADLGGVRADDTVDVVVTRSRGRWVADELILLDTD